jgi:cyclic-di-GMP-binding protein
MSSHSLNLSKPFPPCPMPSNLPLPFAIDEMAFSAWLKSLANAGDMAKSQQILQVLQTLNNAYPPERKLIPGRTRLFFLEKMGSVLATATAMLTNFPNITDSSSGSTDDESARSEISVWGSLELANAYSLLGLEDWFKEDGYYSIQEKTLILCNGIQAMARGLLFIFQTYTKPYVYFWHKYFQFYRLAHVYRLTDSEFNPNAKTIENAFKRVLVFALSNTNQFSPQEMRTIYDLLGHYSAHASLLKSVPKKKFKGIPSIHLKGNGPPTISDDDSDNHDPDRLYIATVTVASKILEATYDKRAQHLPTDRLMLLRLAKTLTLNEQRKDFREATRGNHLGIMGFENIVEFLLSKEVERQRVNTAIGSFDPNRPGELRDLDFEITSTEGKEGETGVEPKTEKLASTLVPAAFQIIEFTDPADIWKNSQPAAHEVNMRLVDKSTKGYGLLWTDTHIKPRVGSIIGIVHKTLSIGLIRWLAQSKETGMFMGVELLGINATTVKVSNPGYPDDEAYAIYLPGEGVVKQAASLIFINKEFRPEEFIFLNKNLKNVRYRQTKQLHLTTFINHVEVVRSH